MLGGDGVAGPPDRLREDRRTTTGCSGWNTSAIISPGRGRGARKGPDKDAENRTEMLGFYPAARKHPTWAPLGGV